MDNSGETSADKTVPVLIWDDTLGRLIRSGGWKDLAEGTPRLVTRALAAGDTAVAKALSEFFITEMRVVFDIYTQWFRDTRRYLCDQKMTAAAIDLAQHDIRTRLALFHRTATRPRDEVWSEISGLVRDAASDELSYGETSGALERAVVLWRDLHDCEVDHLSGLSRS